MSTSIHAVVWLDRLHAQVLQFDTTQVWAQTVKAHIHYTRHHDSKVRSEHEFFDEICDSLAGIDEVLVAGFACGTDRFPPLCRQTSGRRGEADCRLADT